MRAFPLSSSPAMADGAAAALKERLLRERKLVLVLDLDHTLLHTVPLRELSPAEHHLLGDSTAIPSLYALPELRTVTKIRPFVRSFLDEASRYFLVFVFTLGARHYAHGMAALLDPTGSIFSGVFSREDCPAPGQKSLSLIPCDDSLAVILDDTPSVWTRHEPSLVTIPQYVFFGPGGLSAIGSDESATKGPLVDALRVLQRLHWQVFHSAVGEVNADVPRVLAKMRREILRGCKIMLAVGAGVTPKQQPLWWRTAEECGAVCATAVGAAVTHVVSTYVPNPRSRWTAENGKFLVKPQWIEAAYYSWRRPAEEDFSPAPCGGAANGAAGSGGADQPMICG